MSHQGDPAIAVASAQVSAQTDPTARRDERLLSVRGLSVLADTRDGPVTLVDDVSFDMRGGEVLGLVGESGSGKTMIGMALMQLLPRGVRAEGSVTLDGVDLFALSETEIRKVRGGQIGVVFQEPVAALNPAFTIGSQIIAAIRAHSDLTAVAARERAIKWLGQVRIPEPSARLGLYPHQLSGGMCQRVMIAMALAGGAKLLVADEPTTSLDVTIQGQVVSLLEQIVRETGVSILFISHDLGLVSRLCDRLAVAYAGELVETGDTGAVLSDARHPYTQSLVKCVPSMREPGVLLRGIAGYPPQPGAWPEGCRFSERCVAAEARCAVPQSARALAAGRMARCWRAEAAEVADA